ncbi:MAG: transcription termination/antitermination protein NusG [Pirellulales bacterium]|jgi:transcriptional antiterminator NusG
MSDDEVVSDDTVDSPGIQEAGSVVPSAGVESVHGLGLEVPVEGVSGGEVEEELNEFGFAAADMVGDEEEEMGDEGGDDVSPIEEFVDGVVSEEGEEGEEVEMSWYILKVQVNRENSICDALRRRVKVAGVERFFGEVLVPTEDIREFNKAGKQRITKRKLYPGYIVVNMAINDDSWFLVRETSGIGDFTGAAGKPAPLTPEEVSRIIATTMPDVEEDGEDNIKTAIPFKVGDRVRVKEGYFQNHEGEVSAVDERNGRITVMINIFGRPNPVELDHWHVENV